MKKADAEAMKRRQKRREEVLLIAAPLYVAYLMDPDIDATSHDNAIAAVARAEILIEKIDDVCPE